MALVRHRYTDVTYRELLDDTRIKHRDKFHMKYVYMLAREWLIEHGYCDRSDPNFPEELYLHRFTQKSGQEVWIWWRFEKKMNPFVYYHLDIDWHMIGLKDIEVIHNGMKYKANSGEPEFKIYAKVIVDPPKNWKENRFLNGIFEIFWKRMYKSQLDNFRKDLYRDTFKFKEAMKTYFRLKTYLPEPQSERFWLDEEFETQQL